MTTMPKFDALQAAHDVTLAELRKWVGGPIEPGDFAARNTDCPAAIRARNVACSPLHVWHPTSHGEAL